METRSIFLQYSTFEGDFISPEINWMALQNESKGSI